MAPTGPVGDAGGGPGGQPPGGGLVEVFAAERPRLVGLAYRMTGSRLDAEDIVQEAWLRAQRVDWASIDNPAAWLTTVVSRLALDDLKSARRRRESYVGPWLAEPVRTPGAVDIGNVAAAGGVGSGRGSGRSPEPLAGTGSTQLSAEGTSRDPAEIVELAETLTYGFLRLLDALDPVERVVFLLADVFDTPYKEIAAIVDRSPDACRQIASRARRRVRAGRPRHDPPGDAARVAVEALAAVSAGDVDRAMSLLAEDVVLISDGGAESRAARRPVFGPFRVVRLLVNVQRRYRDIQVENQMATVNGEPAVLGTRDGRVVYVVCAEVSGGLVRAIHIVNNPAKLAALDLTTPLT